MKTDSKISKTIALAGNPNSGKTTLFNALTGSNQHIGNWPGVTVERKEGRLTTDNSVKIVDLPGIYSLSPLSLDEKVAAEYLSKEKPDLIINIVDATNLERNLFLTTQLLELGCNMVVALNMQDELAAQGKKIDNDKLTQIFGVKFIRISASKKIGLDELVTYSIEKNILPPKPIALTKTARDEIAAERYAQISKAVCAAMTDLTLGKPETEKLTTSDKIDKIVTNKWLAFPIFAAVMTLIFYISIDGLGGFLTDLINERFTPWLLQAVAAALTAVPTWLSSLIVDGILTGVLSVVGFVPQIMILFGFISALEASGYMARIAFIMDRLFSRIGLNGKSFVAIIIGCGCSVPAIMSTRTIKNERERNSTITLAPMMPCSAKLALFSFFTTAVFGGNGLIAVSLYFLSIICIILGGLILKLFAPKKKTANDTFIMELPTYRIPQIKNVLREMWERGKAFLIKAGTIIFTASIILWVLQSFSAQFIMVEPDQSMLAALGRIIAPVFAPLGWGEWQMAVATLTGLAAKETVVTTLGILYNGAPLSSMISPLSAYSFLTFNLLCAPCVAAISASFKEQGKAKYGFISLGFQIGLAYLVSLLIYQTGTLAHNHANIFWSIVLVALIALALFFCIKYLAKHKTCSCGCENCPSKASCISRAKKEKDTKAEK